MIGAVAKKGLSAPDEVFNEIKQGRLTLVGYLDEIADVDSYHLAERAGHVKHECSLRCMP